MGNIWKTIHSHKDFQTEITFSFSSLLPYVFREFGTEMEPVNRPPLRSTMEYLTLFPVRNVRSLETSHHESDFIPAFLPLPMQELTPSLTIKKNFRRRFARVGLAPSSRGRARYQPMCTSRFVLTVLT